MFIIKLLGIAALCKYLELGLASWILWIMLGFLFAVYDEGKRKL